MNESCSAWHDVALAAPLDARSLNLRRLVMRALLAAGRGHLGSSMSLVEILRVLYDDVLHHDPQTPTAADRDRCILSKGHGCLALYALLADKGFFSVEELDRFCGQNAMLGGHPSANKIPGVEASTGALGHGLSIGVGMALAGKRAGATHKVFVVLGDGECNEGAVWEAAMSAAKHGVDNLVAVVDYNKQQSWGKTCEVQDLEPFAAKWRAFGFAVREVNGHDVSALRNVLKNVPFEPGKPSAVICHTVKGKGVSVAEDNLAWHHKSKFSDEEQRLLSDELAG